MRDAREIIRLKSSLVSTHGTAILPARPRKPREKTKVEQAMLIVERWLLGARRTRATDFTSLADVDVALGELRSTARSRACRLSPENAGR